MLADTDAELLDEDHFSICCDGDDIAPVPGLKKKEAMGAIILTGFTFSLNDFHKGGPNQSFFFRTNPFVFGFRHADTSYIERGRSVHVCHAAKGFYLMMEAKSVWVIVFIISISVFALDPSVFAKTKKKRTIKPAQSLTAEETVWIKRTDGALSCSPEKAQSLGEGAQDLEKAKIRVLESKKIQDGKMHIQMCGAPTGTENAYRIQRSDLPQAIALGFQLNL